MEYIHSKAIIHRDIKPDNFLIGLGVKNTTIHLIDFGLSKLYKNPKTGTHIPLKQRKQLIGTARYASINTHMGLEQSRRDDIEAILYVLIYFLKGTLSWQGLKENDLDTKYNRIKDLKAFTPTEVICAGLPSKHLITYRGI